MMFNKTTDKILSVNTETIKDLEKHVDGQASKIEIHALIMQANQNIIDEAKAEKQKATKALVKLRQFFE
jgi:hypothetical protein